MSVKSVKATSKKNVVGKATARRTTTAAASESSRRPADNDNYRIVLVNRENPRRPGTVQFERYVMIIKCANRTRAEFIAKGGDSDALRYAVAQGHVKLAR